MSFDWGGFGEGLSVGAQRGLVIGQALGEMFRKSKYSSNSEEIDKKYDDMLSQLDVSNAQVSALNNGENVQSATDRAADGNVPVVPAGIQEVAAQDESGKWRPTISDTPSRVSEDLYNSKTHIPLQNTQGVSPEAVKGMVDVAEKNGAYAPTQTSALPRYRGTSHDDERQRIEDQRALAHRKNDMWYYSHDPDKMRELRKEAKTEDFNQGLRTIYRQALNGDPKALGILAGSAEANGLIPDGTHIIPNRDGTFALITEDGHVYQDETGSYGNVTLNRQMIDQCFQQFAITQKAYFDADYKSLNENARANRKEAREDRKLAQTDRQLDIRENYLNSKVATAQATAAAKGLGYQSGKWKPNEDGNGITLFGTDANGNKDYPLAVANSDGTNIRPVALADQWDDMTREVEDAGFKLGVDKNLNPIVVTQDGTQAASYSGWKDRMAEWTPTKGSMLSEEGQEQQTALPQREGSAGPVRGFNKSVSVGGTMGPEAPAQKRAINYPGSYDENGMDASSGDHESVQEGKPSSAEGEAAPGAVAYPEYEDDMIPKGETDWRRYRDPEPAKPEEPQRGYEPGKAPSADKPAPKSLQEINQRLYEDRVTDTSKMPPWLLRAMNADRKRRGLAELPSMSESPKGKSALEMFREMDTTGDRFKDQSMLSDHAKRAIAVSKGEDLPERKAALEDMQKRAASEIKARKEPANQPTRMGAMPEKDRHVSKDEGVAEGLDIRGNQKPYTPKPSAPVKDSPKSAQKATAKVTPKASAKSVQKTTSKPASKASESDEGEVVKGGKLISKPGDPLVKGHNRPNDPKSKEWKYSAKRGDRVYAKEAGTVSHSGWMRGMGNVVIVTDGKGQNHTYTNTDSKLRVGDKVRRGLAIGNAGNQFERDADGNYVGYRVYEKNKGNA